MLASSVIGLKRPAGVCPGLTDRDAVAYRALGDIRLPIDVQVCTRTEFEKRAALPVSFERTVKTKGRIVYAA